MSTSTTIKRLEALRKIIQAGHDAHDSYSSPHIDGMKCGLQIALEQIDIEISSAAALDATTQQIKALIADDGYAMSFQSLGQYRAALLKALGTSTAAGA